MEDVIYYYNIESRTKKVKEEVAVKNECHTLKPITKTKDIDRAIDEILSDPKKIMECNRMANKIIKKRYLNTLKVSRDINSIISNNMKLIKTKRIDSIEERMSKVLTARSKYEDDLIMSKFIISHKQQLRIRFVILKYMLVPSFKLQKNGN